MPGRQRGYRICGTRKQAIQGDGCRSERVIARLADENLALPLIVLALAIVGILSPHLCKPDHRDGYHDPDDLARVVHGVTLSLPEGEFVVVARSLGASGARPHRHPWWSFPSDANGSVNEAR